MTSILNSCQRKAVAKLRDGWRPYVPVDRGLGRVEEDAEPGELYLPTLRRSPWMPKLLILRTGGAVKLAWLAWPLPSHWLTWKVAGF